MAFTNASISIGGARTRPAAMHSAVALRPMNINVKRSSAARCRPAQPPAVDVHPVFAMAEQGGSASKGPVIAAVAAAAAVAFSVIASNPSDSTPTLKSLSERAVPIEQALGNGKPTMIEFYANWCEGCKSMVPDVNALEDKYEGKVNFVMLNVDNPKWLPEIDKYDVDGIPHFEFISAAGGDLGRAVGKTPKSVIEANLGALASNAARLPYADAQGEETTFDPAAAAAADRGPADPLAHGATVAR